MLPLLGLLIRFILLEAKISINSITCLLHPGLSTTTRSLNRPSCSPAIHQILSLARALGSDVSHGEPCTILGSSLIKSAVSRSVRIPSLGPNICDINTTDNR